MRKVQFLRHAESTANAGVPTANPSDIPLTEAGRQAAETAAMKFDATPDLIVVSPYRRTRETAAPFRARFPNAPVEEWFVHEFSYLSPERCGNSTQMNRVPLVEAYWRAATPESIDGLGTESFQEFMGRVETTRRRLQQRPENAILVVSHEMFIKAAMWQATQDTDYTSPDAMRRFREFYLSFELPNLGTWCC